MVVKREDFRIFVDENMKIRATEPGQQDTIRLINACGIRGLSNTNPKCNRDILKGTFKTALSPLKKESPCSRPLVWACGREIPICIGKLF